jgi:hypothetical protein
MIVTFARDGQEIGQHDESAVAALLATGQLLPSDHYWHEGLAGWGVAGERVWPTPPPPAETSVPPARLTPVPSTPAARPAVRVKEHRPTAINPLLVLLALLVWSASGYLYWIRPDPTLPFPLPIAIQP